jgi:hypothetical protein
VDGTGSDPRAKAGQCSHAETLGVSLIHKSNLVPSGSIGPPHHILSVGLCEAMGISTLFSLEREWKPTTDTHFKPSLLWPYVTS